MGIRVWGGCKGLMEDKDGYGGPDIGVKGFGRCGGPEIGIRGFRCVWRAWDGY